MKKFLLLMLLALAPFVQGQIGYATAKRIIYGSVVPASCNHLTGDVFHKTVLPNEGPYYCDLTNHYAYLPGASVGTVVSFTSNSAGISTLFTTSVATSTTTPTLSYTLTTFPQHTFWGNNTSGTATPGPQVIGTADLPFTYSGNTTNLATTSGVIANLHLAVGDGSGNLVDGGLASAGSSGTVNAGTINIIPAYTGTGTIVGPTTLSYDGATLVVPATIQTTAGAGAAGTAILGNASSTLGSLLDCGSGDGASNAEPCRIKLWASPRGSNLFTFIYSSTTPGRVCTSATDPVANCADPLARLSDITAASTPTGTGFVHVTSGTQDGASKKVDLSLSADVQGNLPVANLNSGTGATANTVWHGNATWAAVSLSADVTGNLPVANLNSGTGAGANTLWHGNATWGAVSLTADITGILGHANGGNDVTTITDDTILIADGANWVSKSIPNCVDSGGNHLNYTAATNSLSCGTSGSGGASFPLTSPTANPATAGSLRLAVTDTIGWRNNANSGNLALGVDASDNLTFPGGIFSTSTANPKILAGGGSTSLTVAAYIEAVGGDAASNGECGYLKLGTSPGTSAAFTYLCPTSEQRLARFTGVPAFDAVGNNRNIIMELADYQAQTGVAWPDTSASTTAYTILPQPQIVAYADNMKFVFTPNNNNSTGAPSLGASGLAGKVITKNGGGALIPGELKAGKKYEVTYNAAATQFELTSPGAIAPVYNAPGTVNPWDNTLMSSHYDSSGNPDWITGGTGSLVATIDGSATPAYMYIGGVYQKLGSSITVTLTASLVNYIFAKQDTSTPIAMVAGDFAATTNPPFYQYTAPTCPGNAAAQNSYWFNLAANQMYICTVNSGSYAAAGTPVIFVGEAYTNGSGIRGIVSEPWRLTPHERFRQFGTGADGVVLVTAGTTNATGYFNYQSVVVDTGTLQAKNFNLGSNNDVKTLGLWLRSQTPVLVIQAGVIRAQGRAATSAGTGAGSAGSFTSANGFFCGAGGGGGGSGVTSAAGGAGGARPEPYVTGTTTGGGTAGAATPTAGGIGDSANAGGAMPTNLLLNGGPMYMCLGGTGGSGAGDGTNNGGQSGLSGGTLYVAAPSVLIDTGNSSKIQADGGAGSNGAAGNAGGGGGGGGGISVVAAGFIAGAANVTAAGGAGGAGVGTGQAGGAGGAGTAAANRIY